MGKEKTKSDEAEKKLVVQNKEKTKQATDQKEASQAIEIEKCAEELTITKKELNQQEGEKIKRNSELSLANMELVLQNKERDKRTLELKAANKALKKIKKQQRKYIQGLEEMMFLTSHAVRKPVANILGIATQLDESKLPEECRELIECMKISAVSLDVFTQELTVKINTLKEKGIIKNWTGTLG